jgi:hypothetical protein
MHTRFTESGDDPTEKKAAFIGDASDVKSPTPAMTPAAAVAKIERIQSSPFSVVVPSAD